MCTAERRLLRSKIQLKQKPEVLTNVLIYLLHNHNPLHMCDTFVKCDAEQIVNWFLIFIVCFIWWTWHSLGITGVMQQAIIQLATMNQKQRINKSTFFLFSFFFYNEEGKEAMKDPQKSLKLPLQHNPLFHTPGELQTFPAFPKRE